MLHVNIVGRDKSVVVVEPNQDPVGIRRVKNFEDGIFGKGELLIGLPGIFVESTSMAEDRSLQKASQERQYIQPKSTEADGSGQQPNSTHLFHIVVWH